MSPRPDAPRSAGACSHPAAARRRALAGFGALAVTAVAAAGGARTAAGGGAFTGPRAAAGAAPDREAMPSPAPYAASLLSYDSGGARVRALVAVPDRPRPRAGFPLLVACHGFHPDPPRYGISASGDNARPGDYYRGVPCWYTEGGFVVAMPDYRGHNDSAGHADTGDPRATLGYASDVRALFGALEAVPEVDLRRVFLWGHSMGAEVALRVLAGLADEGGAPRVRGASLWSIAGSLPPLSRLDAPVLLQHAAGDPVAPRALSSTLATQLRALGRLRALELLPGEAHFFAGGQAAQAVRRDLDFFAECMTTGSST